MIGSKTALAVLKATAEAVALQFFQQSSRASVKAILGAAYDNDHPLHGVAIGVPSIRHSV